MPLGFTFEQWQPLVIASIHLGAFCIRQIRLSALEYHREIVIVGVSIHTIAVVGYQARDLLVFNCMGLLIHKLDELGLHASFQAKTSDRSIHDKFSLFSILSCSCANNRLVHLPPAVCLKSAVFSSWETSKFCSSSGEQGGGKCVETRRF